MTLWNVLVTGGAGYVGSALVPRLLTAGHRVKVLDVYCFGDDVLSAVADNPNLTQIKGDIRDRDAVARALDGCDAVIHLACISNDPSFELDPVLGRSINYDCFRPLVRAAKRAGVKRFIYASSSSVYGIKREAEVTEDLPVDPLTDYSKLKAMCERVLEEEREPGFVTLTLRPATVCGYAPRMRLDVIVNILTNHAVNKGKISVLGGAQKRPNIHIDDMTDLYVQCLACPDEAIDGKIFNAGHENYSIMEIAAIVRDVVGPEVKIVQAPTDDQRSYHISSAKIRNELGFLPQRTIAAGVRSLVDAFSAGRIPDPMSDPRYYNIRALKAMALS